MTEQEKVIPLSQPTREQLVEKINKGEKLSDEEINLLKYQTEQAETKTLDRIIRGVNDTFIKDYDFKEFGMKFTIKIKAPNAIDQGKIQARREAYLEGMGMAVSTFIFQVYHTLATIRVCGVDVPKELEKDEDIFNLHVLYAIGGDFAEWLNSFRC